MSTTEIAWLCIGFTGQALFTARILVQWIVSERHGESVTPSAFWILSLLGSWLLLAYAIYQVDPVIIFGQAFGSAVYTRNLVLIGRSKKKQQAFESASPKEKEKPTSPPPLRRAG